MMVCVCVVCEKVCELVERLLLLPLLPPMVFRFKLQFSCLYITVFYCKMYTVGCSKCLHFYCIFLTELFLQPADKILLL